MDGSRIDLRTVALALLCLTVVSFAAATLDTTRSTNPNFGMGNPGQGDQSGGQRTPTETPSGDSSEGSSILDLDTEAGSPADLCVVPLKQPPVQALLLLGLVGIFLAGRRYDDTAMGLGLAVLVAYPGFFVYVLLTSCQSAQGDFLETSSAGQPSQEGGGLMGGGAPQATPSLVTNVLLLLVLGLLGVVALLVLTGDHDQTATGEGEEEMEEEAADDVSVAAIGAAAGRAADRLERDGEFENEVYRAWAEMTEPLSVSHPESSTPGEFAAAAVDAGMDREDVEQLTRLFADVRYGGAEATAEREAAAVETLRRIETEYADGSERS